MKNTIFIFISFLATISTYGQELEWARSFGSISTEEAYAIAVDHAGNVYTAGYFYDTVDFDPGAGTFELFTQNENYNTFITKFDPNGNFVWAVSFKGYENYANDLSLDDLGNVYVSGDFEDTVDFDPGTETYTQTAGYATYTVKLDANGNFVWCKMIENASVNAIEVKDGFVYLSGYYSGTTDFNPGPAVANSTVAGAKDIFALKLDSDGNFIWAKSLGGTNYDIAYDITSDENGNVYITGYFQGTADFDPGVATYELNASGNVDFFIVKLNPEGYFIWVQSFGGNDNELGRSIAIDNQGDIYVCGFFQSTLTFDLGESTLSMGSNGNYDALVVKYSSTGEFIWAKPFGGSDYDEANAIAIDPFNNPIITGYYNNTIDLDPGVNAYEVTSTAYNDMFLVSLNSSGIFQWGASFGSEGDGIGYGLATDLQGNIYATGAFSSTVDFGFPPYSSELTSNGDLDVFVQKIKPSYTGTNESLTADFNLYPNPVTDFVFIDLSEMSGETIISLRNSNGQVLHRQTNLSGSVVPLSLTPYASGIYFVEITTGTGYQQKKLIRQ